MTTETLNLPMFYDESPPFRSMAQRSDVDMRAVTRLTLVFPEVSGEDSAALYEIEKSAFEWLLPSLENQYAGKYVAIHRGELVDSDESCGALVRRFFRTHGDTHVYIGYVGDRAPIAHQLTPFRF